MSDEDFKVYACKDTTATDSGRPWWYEIETGDPGKESVCHTDGMFATEAEALNEGNLWAASARGRQEIAEAFRRSCYRD